jgi:hypothetical protein
MKRNCFQNLERAHMKERKKKPLLAGERAFAKAFSDMWREENVNRMEDLGVFSLILRNEAAMLTAVCVHLLDIPLSEYEELAKRVPETTPGSDAYVNLLVELDCEREETDEAITPLLHTAIVNAVIREYNRSAT